MGLLDIMKAHDISTRLDATQAAQPTVKPAEQTAITRCPKCQLPYGRHYWLDAYGSWHCTECDPPAVLALVRGEYCFPADGSLGPLLELPEIIAAVLDPDGTPIYWRPDVSVDARREILWHIEIFNRRNQQPTNRL